MKEWGRMERKERGEIHFFFNADIYVGSGNSVAFSLPCLKLILIYTKE